MKTLFYLRLHFLHRFILSSEIEVKARCQIRLRELGYKDKDIVVGNHECPLILLTHRRCRVPNQTSIC